MPTQCNGGHDMRYSMYGYMARSDAMNGHQIDTPYNEIELRAQHLDTITSSIINTFRRAYVVVPRERQF